MGFGAPLGALAQDVDVDVTEPEAPPVEEPVGRDRDGTDGTDVSTDDEQPPESEESESRCS
jgi:hypothetical protein